MTAISSGAKGALAELVVAADLVGRGYQVFRNVAPNGLDLLAVSQAGSVFAVEVKTGRRRGWSKGAAPRGVVKAMVRGSVVRYVPALADVTAGTVWVIDVDAMYESMPEDDR